MKIKTILKFCALNLFFAIVLFSSCEKDKIDNSQLLTNGLWYNYNGDILSDGIVFSDDNIMVRQEWILKGNTKFDNDTVDVVEWQPAGKSIGKWQLDNNIIIISDYQIEFKDEKLVVANDADSIELNSWNDVYSLPLSSESGYPGGFYPSGAYPYHNTTSTLDWEIVSLNSEKLVIDFGIGRKEYKNTNDSKPPINQ